jgi:hypothetical protein
VQVSFLLYRKVTKKATSPSKLKNAYLKRLSIRLSDPTASRSLTTSQKNPQHSEKTLVLNPVFTELSHNKIMEQDEFEEDSFSENSECSNSSFSITSKKEDQKKEEKSTRKVKKTLKKKLTKHIGSQMKALFNLSSLVPKTELEFGKKIINISNLSASKAPKLVEQKHKVPLHLRIPNSKKQVMERGSLAMKLGQLND